MTPPRGIAGDLGPRRAAASPPVLPASPSVPAPTARRVRRNSARSGNQTAGAAPLTRRVQASAQSAQPSAGRLRRTGRWLLEAVQYPAIAGVALAAAYSATIGQWIVVGYAVLALLTRRSSNLSFGGGLFMLLTVPFFTAIGQSGIAQNASIYGFELLVFGTAQALWKLYKINKTPK